MTDTTTSRDNNTGHSPDPAEHERSSRVPLMLGALFAVILANAVQISAGLASVEPSPPTDVLPLIAATAALGVAAAPMVRVGDRVGLWLGIASCTLSMIGMGPRKLLLDDGLTIAPLALVGFGFEVTLIGAAVLTLRCRSRRPTSRSSLRPRAPLGATADTSTV